jgi:hypothetical protein
MNRRQFIKAAVPVAALPAIAITCKYEDDEKGPERESSKTSEGWKRWDYRVYCYERGQGEWLFSENTRGSFAHQREYMTFEEDEGAPYAGWMDGGKLHFATFDDATDFVDCHVRAKDDTNLIDSIYDIYFVSRKRERECTDKHCYCDDFKETEIQVAHYWFNGDTGRTVVWEQGGFNSTIDFS